MKRLLILPIIALIGAASFCSGIFSEDGTAVVPDSSIVDNAPLYSDGQVDENLQNVTTTPVVTTPVPSTPAESENAPIVTPQIPAQTTTRFDAPEYDADNTYTPSIDESTPVVTTPPVTTTTTTPPVTTTPKPPVTTTKPPVTTTKPPVTTTTKAPETTKAPAVNTPTGSSKDKFLSIVKNEIGTAEKGHNNIKYNTWYYGKKVQDKTSSGATYAWCAVFVSWCADQADIPQSVIPKTASSRVYANYYNNLGRYTKYKSSYTPKVGDLIFIDWDKKRGSISTIDHVGIVIAVEDGKVITVEGNYSNQVSCNTYYLNDRSITGYATPAYK